MFLFWAHLPFILCGLNADPFLRFAPAGRNVHFQDYDTFSRSHCSWTCNVALQTSKQHASTTCTLCEGVQFFTVRNFDSTHRPLNINKWVLYCILFCFIPNKMLATLGRLRFFNSTLSIAILVTVEISKLDLHIKPLHCERRCSFCSNHSSIYCEKL